MMSMWMRPIVGLALLSLLFSSATSAYSFRSPAVAGLAPPLQAAATYTVTSTNDSGPGSLRQAILDANASPGADLINFAIPGSGVQTISPQSPLPPITEAVTIDGYTQPGAVCSSWPYSPLIELDGTNAGRSNGLTIAADTVAVRGLVINRFNGNGIAVTAGSGAEITGNFIGTDPTGASARPNGSGVSTFRRIGEPSPRALIGGTGPCARNLISGNGGGVLLLGIPTTNNRVWNNYIGTAADGSTALGNALGGIIIEQASNNELGGTEPNRGNRIAHNGRAGIFIIGYVATGNAIRGNAIFANGDVGIDLGATTNDGVTANDPGDADTANANLWQNFPELDAASTTARIAGTLNSTPNMTFSIDFYASPACDPSGYGEGEIYLGSTSATTDAAGNAGFAADLAVAAPAGSFITATATDPQGNTSEFSRCLQAVQPAPTATSPAPATATPVPPTATPPPTVTPAPPTSLPIATDTPAPTAIPSPPLPGMPRSGQAEGTALLSLLALLGLVLASAGRLARRGIAR